MGEWDSVSLGEVVSSSYLCDETNGCRVQSRREEARREVLVGCSSAGGLVCEGMQKETMRLSVLNALVLGVMTGTAPLLCAQTLDYERAGAPVKAAAADPAIAAAIRKISPEAIHTTIERLVAFRNRSTISSEETDLAAGTGVLAAADWIHGQFEAISKGCGGCLEVKDDVFVYTPPAPDATGRTSRYAKPTKLHNVYAVLRGSDPAQAKRMYLITGHYDTRNSDTMDAHGFAPGANDDSSGTAVSLETARVLSGTKLPATLVFVAVAGEEQGLNGSHHLAELAKTEGWDLEGVLNDDIVGGDTTPGETLQSKSLVRVFSQGVLPTMPAAELRTVLLTGAENDTPSRQLAREVLAVGRTYFPAPVALKPVMELRLDRYLRGGDHSSFSAEGFPAVRFTEWRENFNHQHQNVRTEGGVEYGDLIRFDDFDYMARVARLNAATLATLASGPGVPGNVKVVTKDLDNNTTLTWEAPAAGGAGVRYEIVWRETAATDWQYAVSAEGALNATLPVSKDNVFFGVRACDGKGHCSQAVAPVPAR